MNEPLIWLHEEALRVTHPVFSSAPERTRAIYVWDDRYLRQLNYSLKRLVFIYETLCELPVDILGGDTVSIIKQIAPSILYVPETTRPHITITIGQIKSVANIKMIQDENFVTITKVTELRRFFPYWNIAQKLALQKNGGVDA
jgi:hypothetical protein